MLTEQVQTQGTKISDLERTVSEKNQLLSNADDLLQRVSQFAKTVGIQIDKQKVPRISFFFSLKSLSLSYLFYILPLLIVLSPFGFTLSLSHFRLP